MKVKLLKKIRNRFTVYRSTELFHPMFIEHSPRRPFVVLDKNSLLNNRRYSTKEIALDYILWLVRREYNDIESEMNKHKIWPTSKQHK